jgi:tape measure domain-containing protein
VALNGSIVITTKVETGQATASLDGLKSRIEALEKAQDDAAKSASRQAEQTNRLAAASNAAGVAVGIFAAAATAAAIGSIKLAADLEQAKVAFTTLLGSGEKAKKFLDELAAFAARTPFEFIQLQDASRRMLAFGFAAKDILPILNAVGSAAAGLGLGKEGIDRITLALGQMQAKGKVSAQELNQLAEAGVPGWEMIAKAIGTSIPEAMKLAEKGAIDSTTAINALINGMNAKFPGMLEKQSQTINGQLSNLRDGVTLTATLIGERLISAFHIAEVVGNAARAVSGFAQVVKTGGLREALDAAFPPGLKAIIIGIAGTITAVLLPALGAAVVAAAPFLAIGAGIAAAAYLVIKNWEPVSAFFGDLFGKIGRMAEGLRDTILRALGKPIVELGTISRTSMRLSQAGASIKPTSLEAAVAQPSGFLATFKNMLSDFVPDLSKFMQTTVTTVANTAFTGLSGKAPAAAAPAPGGKVKSPEQVAKEAQQAIDHSKKLEADYRAWQYKQDQDAIERSKKLETNYIAWQADQDRKALAERERLEREAQARTASGLRDAYGAALNLISGDFQTFFTTISSKIGDTIFQTLASNPAIQQAMEGVTNSVAGTVSQMVSGLLGGGLDAAGAAVSAGLPGIMASFSSLGAVLAPLLPVIVAIGAAIMVFQQVWDQNVAYIQENFAALGQAIGFLWNSIMSGLQPVIDIVGSALSALAGPLTLVAFIADTVISAFTGVYKAVWDAINAFAPLKWIVDGISWVFNGVIDAVLAVVNWFRALPFVNAPALTRDNTTGAIGMAPPAAGAPTEVGDYVFVDGKWQRKSAAGYDRVRGPSGAFEFKPKVPAETKPAVMPGETPDKPIYTQVVNVRDFRDAFPDSAYFRAPSVDTTRSLNANAVAYR